MELQDVIINEGLTGWNVRFYLAAVKKHPVTGFSLDVMFEVESILPTQLDVANVVIEHIASYAHPAGGISWYS